MRRILSFLILQLFLFFHFSYAQFQTDYLRINGYYGLQYEKMFGDEGRGDPNGSIDVDAFDLVINVFPTDNLRFAVDLNWEHGVETEKEWGNASIQFGFAEYSITNWLKVRAGKIFTPFGIYNEIHAAVPITLTVKEPYSTDKANKFGRSIRFFPRRMAAIALTGDFEVGGLSADYDLTVSNGSSMTVNPFEEDDNKEKAYSGRIRLSPIENMSIGASFYTDQLSELDSLGEITNGRTGIYSAGAQLEWNLNKLGLELEYVYGMISPSMKTDETSNGYMGILSYKFKERYTPYFRYQYLDPNSNIDDDQAQLIIYGINIKVVDNLFLKAEINNIQAGTNNTRFKGIGYNEFKAAVALGF